MARVTVEDCVTVIPNRFELVVLASQRARDIGAGAPLTVERDNDKNPVIALREIAKEHIAVDQMRELLVQSLQTRLKSDVLEQLEDKKADANAVYAALTESDAPADEKLLGVGGFNVPDAEDGADEEEESNFSFEDEADIDEED